MTSARRGSVLVVVVLLLVVGGVVVLSVARSAGHDLSAAVVHLDGLRAERAAEAAAALSLREIAMNSDLDGDGAMGSISNDGNAANNPTLLGVSLGSVAIDLGDEYRVETLSAGSTGRSAVDVRVMKPSNDDSYTSSGLAAAYFRAPAAPSVLSDIPWTASPAFAGKLGQLNLARTSDSVPLWLGGPNNNYGARYTANVVISQSGLWTFSTTSDDGTQLWVDGVLVVNNDGLHSMRKRGGSINLNAGSHAFEVRFFERTGNHGLIVEWRGPGVAIDTVIPASAFSHTDDAANPANRLVNGGFESTYADGDASLDPGWIDTEASEIQLHTSVTGPVHGGAVAARITAGAGSGRRLVQLVSGLDANAAYVLSLQVQMSTLITDGQAASGLHIALSQLEGGPAEATEVQAVSTQNEWEPLSIVGHASASGFLCVTIEFSGVSSGTAVIDDVVLRPVASGGTGFDVLDWVAVDPVP